MPSSGSLFFLYFSEIAATLRFDQLPARCFNRRFSTRGRAEFAARVVGVKIDRALGQSEDLRDLGRGLAARHPGQHFDLATVFGHSPVRATAFNRASMIWR